MREEKVADNIMKFLRYYDRYYINNHGNMYTKDGTPDISTHDADGRFMVIEVKAPKKTLEGNQVIQLLDAASKGVRAVVGHYDFDLMALENGDVPVITFDASPEKRDDEIIRISGMKIYETTEIVAQ